MRRFALGCLRYTPDRFGLMRVADFLDAMAGYNEGENDRVKNIAELIRQSTTLIVNVHPLENGPVSAPDLWPFPWDPEVTTGKEVITVEEAQRRQEAQDAFLNNKS
jgi:hypothetical protein